MDERVDHRFRPEDAPLSRPAYRRKRWRLWLSLPIALVALGLGLWYGLAHRAPRDVARKGPQTLAQPVGAAVIGTGDIRVVLNELGTVTSLDTVTVKTQVNGQLIEIGFKEGQIVKKGDF